VLQLTVRPTTLLCSFSILNFKFICKAVHQGVLIFESYQTKIYERTKFRRKRNCTSLNISFSVTSIGSGTGFFRAFLDILLRGKKPAVYRRVLTGICLKNTLVCFSGFYY
jgi:hypothetical protein